MPLPNFIIIGAGKSGTTSLAHQLGQHPDIFISEPKEPHFFSFNWDKGIDWYWKIFAHAGDCRAIGEASVTYSLYPEYKNVPERMVSLLGKEVQLVYIVRNPVVRMLSHCQHDKIAGLVPANVPYQSLLGESEKYFQGSCFASQLERFTAVFGSDRIKIVVFEYYVREPHETLKEIFSFLGVDSGYTVPDTVARNISSANRRVPGVIRKLYSLQERSFIGPRLRSLARTSGVKSLVDRITGQNIDKPELSAGEYRSCYERFLPEISRLSDITGIDLDAVWSPRRD